MSEFHPPSPETTEPLRVVIVDISEHRRQMARDTADSRLGAETAAKRGGLWENIKDFKGMARRAWKGNIFREYYQQKYYREELDSLDASGNLYASEESDDTLAKLTVVNRFASDFDEAIHTDAGERRDLYGEGDAAPNNIRSNIKDLISEFAAGNLDESAFEEEKNRVCALLANGSQEKVAGGLLYADNLLEIAQNVKAAIEHGRGLEEVMAGMEIVSGEAKMGARTEARFNRVDKIVDKLSRSRIGSLLPEALLASSVAVAVAASKFLTQKTIAMATAVTGVMGISGGILGGLRESKRITEERALHMRERASGKMIEENSLRREQLENTRYETIAANDATSELISFFNEDGSMRELSGAEYERAVAYISQIGLRIKKSDVEKIDLLHFSSVENIEDERFALDLALARAKVGLRDYLATQGPDFLPPGLRSSDFDSLYSMFSGAMDVEFSRSQDVRDDAFKTLKRKAILKAASKGVGFGMVFGALTQEAAARIPGYDSYAGLGESGEGAERTTLLRGWLQGHAQESVEGGSSAENLVTTTTGSHSSISVPEGFSVQNGSNGEFLLTDPKGNVVSTFETNSNGQISAEDLAELKGKGATVETISDQHGGLSGETKNVPVYSVENKLNIPKEYDMRPVEGGDPTRFELVNQNNEPVAQFTLNPNGTIPESSRGELAAAGITLNDKVDLIQTTQPTGSLTPEELVWINAKDTEGVRRVLWYGNDTPGKYDLNELRTHAGGVDGTWFDSEGNVVVDITAMRPDGSFMNSNSANPGALAADGSLRLAISASKSTQDNVFDFKFETTPDGRTIAVIPKDSPVHQLFEAGNQENGHGEFNGRYIEIMEFTGEKDPAGAEQVKILGTYLGDNDQEGLQGVIETTTEAHTTTLSAGPIETQFVTFNPEIVTVTSSNIEVSPIVPIPVFGRRGLERLKGRDPEYGYGSRYESRASISELEGDTSPRLRRDPSAVLNPAEELSWYRDRLRSKKGGSYVDEIDGALESSEALRSLGGKTRAIVAIPVGAVSEPENIYKTLAIYAKQSPDALEKTGILLHVNWIDDAESDPAKKARIDMTLSEIERAKNDFPALKIGTIQTVYRRSDVDAWGGLIGEVARKLYDTSLMCVEKGIREGRMESSQDVLIIRNDSDAQGMSSNYLGEMIDACEEQHETDAFVGGVRWETERYSEYPGFGVVSNFREVMHALTGRKSSTAKVPTIGINTAVRASTFAALSGVGFGKYVGAGSDDLEVGSRIYAVRSGKVSGRRHGGGYGRRRRASTYTPDVDSTGVRPIAYVRGAQIDSAAARLLKEYRAGKAITEAWAEFDKGGHKDRSDTSGATLIDREGESRLDIDSIASRIELNISSMASNWFPDPARVQTALRFQFPQTIPRGKLKGARVYEVRWKAGKCSFTFTPEGKQWLKNSLERDTSGQHDPLGYRTRRKLYQEYNPKNTKRPNTVRAKMVTE